MDDVADLLSDVARRAADYLAALPQRRVAPASSAVEGLAALEVPLPAEGSAAGDVVALLDRVGSPATVASAGPRYFGFVIGGSFPVAVASNWLATAWDQCAGQTAMSPVASRIEAVAARWICELLRLPEGTAVGFVTGSTAAHMSALAAARRAVCLKQGWDVDARGVAGGPPIDVVVTGDVHVSVLQALGLLGLGRESVTTVPVDAQGRIRVDCLPECGPSTIVVVQSGNVNSGSFDDLVRVAEVVERSGAWMHVDGAFGVWARASARYASLVEGLERADSIAASAHKLLNVPYDSAIATCRHADVMEGALTATTSYAVASDGREPNHFTPEGSRRARGIDVWAVLKSLGSSGLAAHVESCCANARRFADVLRDGGITVLNDVVFNQVLFDLGPERDELLTAIQLEGTCWTGPTVWHGHAACRASFCGWATTERDAERSAHAILTVLERAAVA